MQIISRARGRFGRLVGAMCLLFAATVVLPVAIPAPVAAAPLPATWCGTDDGAVDRPDVLGGHQIHVAYAVPSDQPDRFGQFARLIARDLAGVDTWWRSQDPTRTPRFDMATFPGCGSEFGALDISHVRLLAPLAALDPSLGDIGPKVASEVSAVLSDSAKKYLIYLDAPGPDSTCGQAQSLPSTGGPSFPILLFLRSQPGCLVGGGYGAGTGWPALTAAHELVHALNTPPTVHLMPNGCPDDAGHVCDSPVDMISGASLNPASLSRVLDVGNDDYYNHPGVWWDVRDSRWLTNLQAPPVGVSVEIDGDTGGSVESTLPGISCPGQCAVPWNPGSVVELTAIPATGYRFGGWEGACESVPMATTCTPPALERDVQLRARFVPVVALEVAIRGRGEVRTFAGGRTQACAETCTMVVDSGERITVRARPSRRFELSRWGGMCRSDRSRCRLTMDADGRIVARFSRT